MPANGVISLTQRRAQPRSPAEAMAAEAFVVLERMDATKLKRDAVTRNTSRLRRQESDTPPPQGAYALDDGGPSAAAQPHAVAAVRELDEIDEISERKDRRKQRVADLQQDYHSPTASPSAQVQRRRSKADHGLSHTQIADHYSNCIKLSAENKISSKNAFSLHIIDYMRDMLSRTDGGETNFQMAGTSLDASAKIYSYRVDVVHQETYKMVGGLGRGATSEKQQRGGQAGEQDGAEDGGEGGDDLDETTVKRKRRRRQGKTIETNLRTINLAMNEVEYEVDPLFRKVCAAFDEGGTRGLIVNTLRTHDDRPQLRLHAFGGDARAATHAAPVRDMAKVVGDLLDALDEIVGRTSAFTTVCEAVENFELAKPPDEDTTVSSEDEEVVHDRAAPCVDAFRFDGPAVVDATEMDDVEEYADATGGELERADSRGAGDVTGQIPPGYRFNSVEGVAELLSARPLEYSYFNTRALQACVGPSHWKLVQPALMRNTVQKTQEPRLKGGRKKKKENVADFHAAARAALMSDDGDDEEKTAKMFDKQMVFAQRTFVFTLRDERGILDGDEVRPERSPMGKRRARRATTLTRAALERWCTLPDLLLESFATEWKPENFRVLFLKPTVEARTQIAMMRRNELSRNTSSLGVEVIDEAIGDYNYACQADGEFCADGSGDAAVLEGQPDGAIDYAAGADDENYATPVGSPRGFDETELSQELGSSQLVAPLMDNVASPNFKPPDLKTVKYDRNAKRVNVRQLKKVMWELIGPQQRSGEEELSHRKAEQRMLNGEASTSTATPPKITRFSELYAEMRRRLPGAVTEQLTPHIVFVVFLHMCNERVLQLDGMPDLEDFTIALTEATLRGGASTAKKARPPPREDSREESQVTNGHDDSME